MSLGRRSWLAWAAVSATGSSCARDARPIPELPAHVRGVRPTELVLGGDGTRVYGGIEFYEDGRTYRIHQANFVRGEEGHILPFPLDYIPPQLRVIWRIDETMKGYPIPHLEASHHDDHGVWKENLYKQATTNTNYHNYTWRDWESHEAGDAERRKLIAKNTGFKHEGPWSSNYTGPIGGDHIVQVASKIPKEVIQELHRGRGGLRIKFLLSQDRVRVGWDIERVEHGAIVRVMKGYEP